MAAIVIIGLICICSLLSSSTTGALSGGLIPNTGPYYVKKTGLDKLKKFIPLADDFNEKAISIDMSTSAGLKKFKTVSDEFVIANKSELDDVCQYSEYLDEYNKNNHNKPKQLLTFYGFKPTTEFAMDYIGGSDNFKKVSVLSKINECKTIIK